MRQIPVHRLAKGQFVQGIKLLLVLKLDNWWEWCPSSHECAYRQKFDCHTTSYGFDICKPNNITVPINETDMNTYVISTAEDKKPVKAVFENENTKNLDETITGIFEKLDQNKLEQEKKECYDYYFGDADWRKNNPYKPIFTDSTKKINKYKELSGGDTEWQQ